MKHHERVTTVHIWADEEGSPMYTYCGRVAYTVAVTDLDSFMTWGEGMCKECAAHPEVGMHLLSEQLKKAKQ
jgi:hypothetical protein